MAYPASYFTARESWRDWRIEADELLDQARVSRGTRVLEIGCGGGGLLRLLGDRGARAVGVDTLEAALQLARERLDAGGIKTTGAGADPGGLTRRPQFELVRIGRSPDLPFADAQFDAVVGQHVVEHLHDLTAAFLEWKRVLKADGLLTLATPNSQYPDPTHFADEDHTHILSPRELCATAEGAGFGIEACCTIFPYLSHARLLRGLGVVGYRLFRSAPYFAWRGRTIILGARRRE